MRDDDALADAIARCFGFESFAHVESIIDPDGTLRAAERAAERECADFRAAVLAQRDALERAIADSLADSDLTAYTVATDY